MFGLQQLTAKGHAGLKVQPVLQASNSVRVLSHCFTRAKTPTDSPTILLLGSEILTKATVYSRLYSVQTDADVACGCGKLSVWSNL